MQSPRLLVSIAIVASRWCIEATQLERARLLLAAAAAHPGAPRRQRDVADALLRETEPRGTAAPSPPPNQRDLVRLVEALLDDESAPLARP